MIFVKAFTFNPVQENTYLMYKKSGSCCIIDPGCYFEEDKQELADFIAKEGLKPDLLLNNITGYDVCHLNRNVFAGNQTIMSCKHNRTFMHIKLQPTALLLPLSFQDILY